MSGATGDKVDAAASWAELGGVVSEAMERLHVPGVAVGLVTDGQTFTAGWGITNVDQPQPVDEHTMFQIGSTTKTVTGTAVMRLVEVGKLDLEAPLRTYLPEMRLSSEEAASGVTLRHLLTHTGGWEGDLFEDTGHGDDALERILPKVAELQQLTPLGKVWSYNNAGFYLAGRVIEVAAGKPYEAATRELVLEPLGMADSAFPSLDLLIRRVVAGHMVVENQPRVARPWAIPRSANAAGGLVSTAPDQARYARFHMGDGVAESGERVLSADSMRLMQSPLAAAGSMADHVGLTWLLRDAAGVRLVSHGGTTNGQLSAFTMAPDRGFAITVLTNSTGGGQLGGDVVGWALQRFLGVPRDEPAPIPVDEATLAAYAGLYRATLTDIELRLEDGGLVLQVTPRKRSTAFETPPPPPPARLALFAEDKVVALDGPFKGAKGEFLRGADGQIEWLRFGGRVSARMPEGAA